MKLILIFCLIINAIIADYKQYFTNGLSAYNEKDYSKAIDYLTKSYDIKKNPKTSYYIAICYFKMGEDSLAEKFAFRAQKEMPLLSDNPYQQNINHILKFCELAPRFKKLRFEIEQSVDVMTAAEMKVQKRVAQELLWYYSDTPDGQNRLFDDMMFVQSRSLINENELKLNMTTGQFYQDPIIDSLE